MVSHGSQTRGQVASDHHLIVKANSFASIYTSTVRGQQFLRGLGLLLLTFMLLGLVLTAFASPSVAAASLTSAKTTPHVAYYNTYYANKSADDAGNDTGQDCIAANNTGCSLRSAINQATADYNSNRLGASSPDLIVLLPYIHNNTNVVYQMSSSYGALPNLPSYVTLEDLNSYNNSGCSNGITNISDLAVIQGTNLPSSGKAADLVLASYDTMIGIQASAAPANDYGFDIQGSHNLLTCSEAYNNKGDGVYVEAAATDNNIGQPNTGSKGGLNGGKFDFIAFDNEQAIDILGNVNHVYNSVVGSYDGFPGNVQGLSLTKGSTANFIGGDRLGGRGNLISGNSGLFGIGGVYIDGTGNFVEGNIVGLTANQSVSSASVNGYGITLDTDATGNIIGGEEDYGNSSGTHLGNIIGDNTEFGIWLKGSSNNILGNYIGTDTTATKALGNQGQGILVQNTGSGTNSGNQIGGTGTGQSNFIAANGNSGITIEGNGTKVQNNYIGVAGDLSGPLFNGTSTGSGSCNTSSSPDEDCAGIYISGTSNLNQAGPSGTVVSDNFIGSQFAGVLLDNASNNTIQNNCIGGCVLAGTFTKNFGSGTGYGVELLQGSSNNYIGGDSSQGQGNTIGNMLFGIYVSSAAGLSGGNSAASTGNHIAGNAIGTDSTDSYKFANSIAVGIELSLAGTLNSIGAPLLSNTATLGNVVENTTIVGIGVYGTTLTAVSYNQLGHKFGNALGIELATTAQTTTAANANVVEYNNITQSSSDAIKVGSSNSDNSQDNQIYANSTYANSGLGIDLNYPSGNKGAVGGTANGPNNQAAEPVLTSASYSANSNQLTISGTFNPNSNVDLYFADSSNANAQGQIFIAEIGASTVGSSGTLSNYAVTVPAGVTVPSNPVLVATSTLTTPSAYSGSTSQFSAPIAVNVISSTPTPTPTSYSYYLPLVANNANAAVGQTTTFVTLQNLSNSAAANVTVQYYNSSTGSTLSTSDSLTIAANGQKAILPNIVAGNTAGGIVTSNQPLNLVVSESLNSGGSAYNVTASTAPTLYSPLALNGQYGFTTSFIIFNTGNATSNGTIQYYDENGNATTTQNFSIPAHASQTINQGNTSGLSNSHSYWAKISGGSSDSLTAQVIEFGPSNFVATFNALVSSQLSSTLYAPAVFNGQFNFATGMGFANPNASVAHVTITYYDATGKNLIAQPLTIPANGDMGVFQPGVSGLPQSVTSASITSDQPLIMTVNERGPGTIAGTYVGTASGKNGLLLPVMANGFASFVTGATVLNTGSSTAHITFTYYNGDGSTAGTAQTATIAPNASYLVYQGASGQGLPSGFFGTAQITSDQPLLVTTNALQTGTGLFYTYGEPSN